MKYIVTSSNVIVSMVKGDFLMECLTQVTLEENLFACNFTGIGAVRDLTLGVFNPEEKSYITKKFPHVYELVSCTGNITLKDGKPFIHCHAVITDHDFQSFGGHIFKATIAAVGEFIITPLDADIIRTQSENIGLAIWDFKDENNDG